MFSCLQRSLSFNGNQYYALGSMILKIYSETMRRTVYTFLKAFYTKTKRFRGKNYLSRIVHLTSMHSVVKFDLLENGSFREIKL